ncbi:DUF1367 family protein [Rugamonas sp.]|uniref:DUF1367 family protein n=1 Tax=Rugamonas sp. TaxID=1926287 RepID=UPI0025DB0B01|nr:DUF1367 family protein [Rugamonas sp.]
MTEIVLMKVAGGALVPVEQAGIDYLSKIKLGAGVKMKVTKHNSVPFHRKIFALLGVAFDAWDAPAVEYRGEPVAKNIEQFREDLTIWAGFYEMAVRLDGTIRFSAKSWSFEKMDDAEKERLYNSIINVVLERVLTNYTRDDLDEVIAKLLRFDR